MKLYEANNHILLHTQSLQPSAHRHMAAHIIISMAGSMKVQCAGAEHLCHGILLPSGVSHTVDTRGNPVLVFLYDCTTNAAKQIREISCIPEKVCKEIVQLYDIWQGTGDSYYGLEKAVLSRLGITEAALEAGFSSSAHFADVNRRVFGISASTITHDLAFTKVQ